MDNIFKSLRRWHTRNVSRGQVARFDAGTRYDLGVDGGNVGRVVRGLN
jgi:hypothetical protein